MFAWILKKHIIRTHFYHSVFVIVVAVAVIVRSFWLLRCKMACLIFFTLLRWQQEETKKNSQLIVEQTELRLIHAHYTFAVYLLHTFLMIMTKRSPTVGFQARLHFKSITELYGNTNESNDNNNKKNVAQPFGINPTNIKYVTVFESVWMNHTSVTLEKHSNETHSKALPISNSIWMQTK